MKVKTALIGHGFLGKWHLEKILAHIDDAELVAVVEKSPEVRADLKAKYPNLTLFEEVDGALPLIDAAIVATPTAFHFGVCQKLIKAGKHVFCEKPVTSQVDQARRLLDLADKQNVIVQVGHSERFHEAWEILQKAPYREIMQSARLVYFDRWAPFKGRATDVDVAQDLMIHDLDLLLWLFGEVPWHVESHGTKIRTPHWDYIHSSLHCPSGLVAHVRAGRGHVQEVRLMEVVSPKGVLKVDLFTGTIILASHDTTEVTTQTYAKRDHLMLEQAAFYKAIKAGTAVPVDLKAGVAAVDLVDQVLKSLETTA